MSMLPVESGHDLDEIRALELIFEDDSLKCRGHGGNGCQRDAEYLVTCPCMEGYSHQCGQCLAEVRRNCEEDDWRIGFFGKTGCGHLVDFRDCTIRPI